MVIRQSQDRLLPSRRAWPARAPVVALLLGLAGCGSGADDGPAYVLDGLTMGTTYRVTIRGELAPDDGDLVRAAVEDALARVNDGMSTYEATSEVSRLNRHTLPAPFAVSPELFETLATAREVSERSGGAFDVTVGPLVDAWGFGPGNVLAARPSSSELTELRASVGQTLLALDRAALAVSKARPDTRVDLSGIAKGWAVEAVSAELTGLGYRDFLVDVGGELRAVGSRSGGRGWRVGLESPDADAPALAGVVELRDEAIATSGDYRNFFESEGRRFAHIIDPRTGAPVEYRGMSVSVVHADGARADAWATALTVLGPEAGLETANREGIAALFAYRSGPGVEIAATAAMESRLVRRSGPEG